MQSAVPSHMAHSSALVCGIACSSIFVNTSNLRQRCTPEEQYTHADASSFGELPDPHLCTDCAAVQGPTRSFAVCDMYAWIAVEDPTLLDYPNAEMVLIGERADAERALPCKTALSPVLLLCGACAS